MGDLALRIDRVGQGGEGPRYLFRQAEYRPLIHRPFLHCADIYLIWRSWEFPTLWRAMCSWLKSDKPRTDGRVFITRPLGSYIDRGNQELSITNTCDGHP